MSEFQISRAGDINFATLLAEGLSQTFLHFFFSFFFLLYNPSHPMPFLKLVDPPTKETLVNARRSLQATRSSVEELTSKIDAAESALAQLVRESRLAINELEGQRAALEDQVSRTLAYLSPIRRLPMELLREIFVWSFEEHACLAWVLAAVCPSWRRLALRIPLIWSKVCILSFYPLRFFFLCLCVCCENNSSKHERSLSRSCFYITTTPFLGYLMLLFFTVVYFDLRHRVIYCLTPVPALPVISLLLRNRYI